ncbi:MAG: hypothetical protein SVM80_09695 [Halobacteriota archaeon]|nr:hypothetical protein [Halobacteriota archaeon]
MIRICSTIFSIKLLSDPLTLPSRKVYVKIDRSVSVGGERIIDEIAGQIRSRFSDIGIDVSIEEIRKRLDLLINEYKVPEGEAKRSITNYFLTKHNASRLQFQDSDSLKIKDIKTEGQWISLKANVIQLWENEHESISQVGLLGDESGIIKFVSWAKAELPYLDEGKSYEFRNVVTDSWNDRFSVKLNQNTQITMLDEEVKAIGGGDILISDIDSGDQWVNLKVKVLQLWDSGHESISQVGLIGDESGTIKFTKWASSGLPDVVEGQCYEFKNVITDYWQERFNIKLNRNSKIIDIDEEISVARSEAVMRGAIVAIQEGSGLIKRCQICNRVLIDESCGEHGFVDGVYDLRIKGVLDDGEVAQDILLNRETTERVTKVTLERAKLAFEEGDQTSVLSEIKDVLLGRYFEVKGPMIGRYILVDEIAGYSLEGDVEDLVSEIESEEVLHTKSKVIPDEEGGEGKIDLVIDASNVAYWEDAKPKLGSVIAVIDRLDALEISYLCVVGPRLRHVIDDRVGLENLLKRSNIIQSPAKKDADVFVLDYANKYNSRILSNDQYNEYRSKYPILLEKGRIVEGLIFDGKISVPDLGI